MFLKILHQKDLFNAIKEDPNFPTCRRILHIYRQWLLKTMYNKEIIRLGFCDIRNNQNYNNQLPDLALIGQCTRHACNWTVRVVLRALLRCTLLSKPLCFSAFITTFNRSVLNRWFVRFSVFVISLSLRLRLITLTLTLIIPDITETSSKNCL